MTEATSKISPSRGARLTVTVVIVNDLGLHARPAAEFVKIANKYKDCQVMVKNEDMQVNGKSIMGLLMLAAGKGTNLELTISGPDCHELARELTDLINGGFGEEITDS
ncbi:MAG: HPr family phosphocarrier protein [Candidatus Sumerlaeia bacterium]